MQQQQKEKEREKKRIHYEQSNHPGLTWSSNKFAYSYQIVCFV